MDELAKKALKCSRINVHVSLGKSEIKGLIKKMARVMDTGKKGKASI